MARTSYEAKRKRAHEMYVEGYTIAKIAKALDVEEVVVVKMLGLF